MDKLIEDVARAIRAARMQFGDVPTSIEHDTLPQVEARNAILATLRGVMEPGEGALSEVGVMEGFDAYAYENDCDRPHIEWWQAMLTQLIKEVEDD